MAIYIQLDKVTDDGRLVKYSFATMSGPRRTLVFDREEERMWPEDGNWDGIFRGAAQVVGRAWRNGGELPDSMELRA
jgi:hypothetical protein